jgi:quercetin dioxygenase-like cupin family protein
MARELALVPVAGHRLDPRGRDAHERAGERVVVEGELVFTIGSGKVTAAAGTTVCAPPGLIHGFESSSEARFLNVHAPDRGFAESLRLRRDGRPYEPNEHDAFEPPEDGGLPASKAIVLGPEEGERFATETRDAVVKVGRDELALVEFTLRPGFEGPKPHIHKLHVDSFYVLDGEVAFRIGDETVHLGSGAFIAAPPGVIHSFGRPGPDGARLINVHAPSRGFHEFLRVMDETEGELDAETLARYDMYEVE